MNKYVSLLRGINVGGHKKVPMAELRKEYEKIGFKHVKTLLASGNVVFEGQEEDLDKIPGHLEKAFGFSIPVITVPFTVIEDIIAADPFNSITVTSKTRLYITFLGEASKPGVSIPYKSEDGSFRILQRSGDLVFSVLDLEKAGTPDAMKVLEQGFGKNITTRNYNTVVKLAKL
jgi:uncharacterized protein (DUF1697 family)